MRRIVASTVILAALAGVAQDAPPSSRVTPPARSSVGPEWDKGVVEGGVYKNLSLGLEITAPSGLEFRPPELKGNAGTLPLLVTVSAVSAPKLLSARNVMTFYSEALAYYPEGLRSSAAYLRRVIIGNQQVGFVPVGESSGTRFGGAKFERQDFRKGSVYEAVLLTACESQAIVFFFAGADEASVDKLLTATQLKLYVRRSGCGSKVLGATPK